MISTGFYDFLNKYFSDGDIFLIRLALINNCDVWGTRDHDIQHVVCFAYSVFTVRSDVAFVASDTVN